MWTPGECPRSSSLLIKLTSFKAKIFGVMRAGTFKGCLLIHWYSNNFPPPKSDCALKLYLYNLFSRVLYTEDLLVFENKEEKESSKAESIQNKVQHVLSRKKSIFHFSCIYVHI